MRNIIYITFFLIFSFNSFSQENEYNYRLLTFGSINYNHSKAIKFVANDWGIEIYKVAGTSIENRVKDSADTKNAELWNKLDLLKNTDTQKEFQKEVIAEFKNIMIAQEIFESSKKVKRLTNKLVNSKYDSYTELEFKRSKRVYVWTIYSIEKDIYFGTLNAEYNVAVDLNTELIEIEHR